MFQGAIEWLTEHIRCKYYYKGVFAFFLDLFWWSSSLTLFLKLPIYLSWPNLQDSPHSFHVQQFSPLVLEFPFYFNWFICSKSPKFYHFGFFLPQLQPNLTLFLCLFLLVAQFFSLHFLSLTLKFISLEF